MSTLAAGVGGRAATGRAEGPLLLDPRAVVEPLLWGLPPWLHSVAPATGALRLARYQLPLLASYERDPELHHRSARDPSMRGGPFVGVAPERSTEVAALRRRIETEATRSLVLADDLAAAQESIERGPAELPDRLLGVAEVGFDVHHRPHLQVHERLLHRRLGSAGWSVRISTGPDRRPFGFTTPRLPADSGLHLDVAPDAESLDLLLRAMDRPAELGDLAEALGLGSGEASRLGSVMSPADALAPPTPWNGDGVRVRYLGHAGVLVEGRSATVVVDPFVSALDTGGEARFSFADLPPTIDVCLVTHGHADHLVIESLLRLRHRIGTVVVPRCATGALHDPSPAACLASLGFGSVQEVSPGDVVDLPGARVAALPFFGEHAGLAVSARVTYGVRVDGASVVCCADTTVPCARAFDCVADLVGRPDLLLNGMECDGAPLSWLYGPLLARRLPRSEDRARTLSGSDAAQAWDLVSVTRPAAAHVYAMGLEPWVDHIMAMSYGPDSVQLREVLAFVERCAEAGIESSLLRGRRDWTL